MTTFTPISSTLGGALIGIAASLLLVLGGRIAGISGILGGLYPPRRDQIGWRGSFVLGLLVGGLVLLVLLPSAFGPLPGRSFVTLAIAGVLVGVGSQLGNGCTSGHGVCGLSRLSARSLAATITFITTGVIAVALSRAGGVS